MKWILVLSLMLLTNMADAKVVDANLEGSGGDALRELFTNAKAGAASKVEALNTCAFSSSTSAEVRNWLIKNQSRLAQDIRLSQQAWVVDSQSTCGFTNHS